MALHIILFFFIRTGKHKAEVEITPIARFYLDGAVYLQDHTPLSNGTHIPDVRLGLKANYSKFHFKVDIGFSNSKVNPKDIFSGLSTQ